MIVAWLSLELNNPSRTDHYLMQNSAEVRRVLADNKNNIKMDDFLIKFVKQVKKPKSVEQVTHDSKSAWMGMLGIKKENTNGND